MTTTRPLLPGLCSVTFRALEPSAVLDHAVAAGVAGIEWGGDVHVPPGDLAHAARLGARCREAGIATPSYGSYLRAGPGDDVAAVLDTAAAVGADNVRVWAGRLGSAEAQDLDWQRTTDALRAMAERAAARQLSITVEYHRNTLTDTATAAARLLGMAGHANLFSYWQPVPDRSAEAHLEELALLRPMLAHLHVFHWLPGNLRRPLAEGEAAWRPLFAAFTPCARWTKPAYAFLEFVQDDSLAQFSADMAVLHRLCGGEPANGST
jgi:3-dehydroshikimate dehydratase